MTNEKSTFSLSLLHYSAFSPLVKPYTKVASSVFTLFTINLKEGVTMEDYLKFFTSKAIPAYDKAFPGMKTYFNKIFAWARQQQYGCSIYCLIVKLTGTNTGTKTVHLRNFSTQQTQK
jgi:hypothetical protein